MHMKISTLLSGMLVLTMLILGAAADEEIENLVSNADFEAGTAGWSLGNVVDGAIAVMKVEKKGFLDECLYIEIDAVGDAGYKPEIHSPSFAVENGELYTVALWAKTEEGVKRDISIKFEQNHDPWGGPSQTFNITEEWTEYHHSPVMPFDDANMVIHIGTQQQMGDIWIDHVRVYKGKYIEEDLEGQPKRISVTPIGTRTATWGQIKSR